MHQKVVKSAKKKWEKVRNANAMKKKKTGIKIRIASRRTTTAKNSRIFALFASHLHRTTIPALRYVMPGFLLYKFSIPETG